MPVMNGYEATTNIRKVENEMELEEGEKHFICGYSGDVN